jgi:hypothetical protein
MSMEYVDNQQKTKEESISTVEEHSEKLSKSVEVNNIY